MYADFESILKPENEDVDVTQGVDTGIESSSHDFQEHIPCSFAYKIVGSVDPDFSVIGVLLILAFPRAQFLAHCFSIYILTIFLILLTRIGS